MDAIRVSGRRPLRGRLRPPGDETLSHAALLLGAMAEGHSLLEWLSPSQDVHATWACLMELGATLSSTPKGEQTAVRGLGWRGLVQPKGCLKVGDSGATAGLLMGVIAGNPIAADIVGDERAQRYPFAEIAAPLREMGASVHLRGGEHLPASVLGAALKGARHCLTSAPAKAAVLLAGTMAIGETSVTEPAASDPRLGDLLARFGAGIRRDGLTTIVTGGLNLAGQRLAVPPDLSWAAFWALAAGLVPRGEVFLEGLSPDDARCGVFAGLLRLGLRPDWQVGGLRVRAARLSGADLTREQASSDPALLALAASQARGSSRLRGAAQASAGLLAFLRGLGAEARSEGEDLVVSGPTSLKPGLVSAGEDERLARAGLLAGLLADGETAVSQARVLHDRYPGLLKQLARL
jgi:3-phosphoshikimate 1-carboxyvinyltransferase